MNKILAILMELGKAFNVPESAITAIVTSETTVDNIDEAALTKLFGDSYRDKMSSILKTADLDKTKAKDEGFKAAERKVKSEIEKLIKEKLYPDSSAETIEDLMEEIITKYAKEPSKKAADLTDEDIKKHPAYITASKEWQKQLKEAKEAGEQALKDLQQGIEKEKTFGIVAEKALAEFDELKPVLSSDPIKAAKQRQLIVERLKGYDFEIVEGNIIIQKDGKVLQDQHLNNIKLADLVKQEADPIFDFQKADQRQSPNGADGGDGTRGDGSKAGKLTFTGPLPKTKKELLALASDSKVPISQRKELMEWGDTADLPE